MNTEYSIPRAIPNFVQPALGRKLHSNWNSVFVLCCPYFHAWPQSNLNSGESLGLKPQKEKWGHKSTSRKKAKMIAIP